MTLYDVFMIPLEKSGIKKARKELIPFVNGTVLEVGTGTGVNLKYYDKSKIDKLILSDQKLTKTVKKIDGVTVVEASVTSLPFSNETFDYVVATLVFCSVDDVVKGLSEIERVLKPGGTYVFIEHILPRKRFLKGMFNFVNPLWRKVASGCNLNRVFIKTLESANFTIETHRFFGNTVFVCGRSTKNSGVKNPDKYE